MTQFSVMQKVFVNGVQIDSDSIAEFNNEADAQAMVDTYTTEQKTCPPNPGEHFCEWYVIAD
jgi:hypothetical protein